MTELEVLGTEPRFQDLADLEPAGTEQTGRFQRLPDRNVAHNFCENFKIFIVKIEFFVS